MSVLTKQKRYQFGGTMTATDGTGMPVEHHAGDPVPDEWLDQRSPAEIAVLRNSGMLREVGAKPAARAPEAPPVPPTPLEIVQRFAAGAKLDGERIEANGYALAGVDFTIIDKAREKDFERAVATGATIPVVVHLSGGQPVATLDLGRLCQLLAGRGLAR